MKKNIRPIFMYHKGYSPYIKDVVDCAEKSGNKVIFFGDLANKNCVNNWVDTDSVKNLELEHFEKVYRHLSTNSLEFEFQCYKRFFIILQYMRDNNIEECIACDTDLLLFFDVSKIDFNGYDAGLSYDVLNKTDSFCWTISGHCSFWKISALENFIYFIIDIYENHMDILKQKWNYMQESKLPGGICDMTLLYLWVKNNQKIKVLNTTFMQKGELLIDHSISAGGSYIANEFKESYYGGVKKIKFKEGIPYFYRIREKRWIPSICIHAQGNKKKYISIWKNRQSNIINYVLRDLYINLGIDKKKYIKELLNNYEMLIVYGTGQATENKYKFISKYKKRVLFCDKKAYAEKYMFHGYSVFSPEEIRNIEEKYGILITSRKYGTQIREELIELGFHDEDIYNFF